MSRPPITNNLPRAALIEISGSHDECLYSHVAMLRAAGFCVRVVLRQDVRNHQGDLGDIEGVDYVPFAAGGWHTWVDAQRLRRLLHQQRIDVCVLNTAEGRRVRNFCVLPGTCAPMVGVLHNGHKLGSSFTQRLIERRVQHYFVLSEFIARQAPQRRGITLETFYPSLFPPVAPAAKRAPFTVVIPGRLDPTRRDYGLLIDELRHGRLEGDVHFVLLGDGTSPAAAELRSHLRAAGIEHRCRCFDGFVDQATMLAEVAGADLILPLITPRTPEFEQYRRSKISGAYNLSYGFGVPMLLHAAFAEIDELRRAGLFFGDGELLQRLNELAARPEPLEAVRRRIAAAPDLAFADQLRRYIGLLGGVFQPTGPKRGERAASTGNFRL